MAKPKSFGAGLAAKLAQDKSTRDSELDKRFETATDALQGRPSLLHPVKKDGPTAAEVGAQALVDSGSAKLRDITLPLAKLRSNPLNSRTFYDEEVVRARAASIAAHGQLFRVLVAPDPAKDGEYIIIDGEYRKRAVAHLNRTEIECRVITGLTKVDFYRLARAANAERQQESVLDVAFGYQKLLDEGLAQTDDELAAIVGESRPKVNKMLALVSLPKSVLDVILQTPSAFGVSVGYELTLYVKTAGEQRTAELAERIAKESLPFSKVEAIRKKAEEGTKATRHTSRQYKLMRGGIELGTLKEWDTGRVTMEVSITDPAKREALLASVKEQLGVDEE